MLTIPVTPVPTQRMAVNLAGQSCDVELRQNGGALYLSLWKDGAPVLLSKICRDRQLLLTGARYRGFSGDLLFVDQTGQSDPVYSGLGTQFPLVYLTSSEVP